MATTYSIKTVISAQDKLSSPLKQISASAVATARGATDKIGEGAKEATGHFFSLGGAITGALGALAGAASIAGVAGMVKGYVESTAELYRLSEQLQISGQSLREFGYVAAFAHVPTETFTASLEFLAKGVGQAQGGYGKLVKALSRQPNGRVLLEQLKAAKGTEEAFELATAAVDKIKNPMQKAALATALFGSNAKDMIRFAKGGVDAIDKMRAQARQDIGVLSPQQLRDAEDFERKLLRLSYQFKSMGGVIARELMPALTPLIDGFRGWAQEMRPIVKAELAAWAKKAADALKAFDWKGAIDGAKWLGEKIAWAHDKIGGFKGEAILFGTYLAGGLVVSAGQAAVALYGVGAALGVAAWPLTGILAAIAALGILGIAIKKTYDELDKQAHPAKSSAFRNDPLQLPVSDDYRAREHTYHVQGLGAPDQKRKRGAADWLDRNLFLGFGGNDMGWTADDAPSDSRSERSVDQMRIRSDLSRSDDAFHARLRKTADDAKAEREAYYGRPAVLSTSGNAQQVKGEMVVRIDSPNLAATVTSVQSSASWFDVTGNVGASPAGSRF